MNLCQRCKKECKHDLEKCTYYSPAKMTNFEKIKAMSIEELARLLGCIFVDCDEFTRTIDLLAQLTVKLYSIHLIV